MDGLTQDHEVDERALKRFFCVFLVIAGLGLGAVWAINYLADPYGARESSIVAPVEQSSRYMKIRLLSSAPKDTNLLILGSSRLLRLLPSDLDQVRRKKSFNAAVTSGGMQDALALTRYAREDAGLPIDEILFGVDIERLSPHEPLRADLLTNHELLPYLREDHLGTKKANWLGQYLTYERLRLSALGIYRTMRYGQQVDAYRFNPDGSRENLKAERALEAGTYDLEAGIDHTIQRYRDICRDFDQLDQKHLAALYDLIDYCQANLIKLTIFLSPTHPKLLRVLQQETHYQERRVELARILERKSKEVGFRFFDLCEVSTYGGREDEYYDGTHPYSSNTKRMIEWIYREK